LVPCIALFFVGCFYLWKAFNTVGVALPHLLPTARRLAFATLAVAASTLSACVSTHPVRVLPK
jgi:hypothetical protein